jgi:hypothetical protein
MRSGRRSQRGLTYLAVLFFVAISGAMLAAVGIIWSHERQREKNIELAWIGLQFQNAIALYHERSPGLSRRHPENLEDLLQDRRHLTVQRYLRRIYRDPLTGEAKWGLVIATEGGIAGIYSLKRPEMRFVYQPRPLPAKSPST